MKLSQNTHSPEEKKQQHFSMHKLFMSAWRSKFLKSIKVWIKSGIGPKPKPTLTLPPTKTEAKIHEPLKELIPATRLDPSLQDSTR